jgi:uncharacterized lipoprotein YddW (UPF0748 family)
MSSIGPGIAARAAGVLAIFLAVCLAHVERPFAAASPPARDRQDHHTRPGEPAGSPNSPDASPAAIDAGETRALWVLRTSLTTPASIAALVRNASGHGFNTLLVQVRGRGDAYYRGGIEPLPPDLLRQPAAFDPLATVIEQAHAAGLRVHAWVNVNLVSSAADLPVAREHLIYRHPGWLMVPRDIAQTLAAIEPESPAYVGTLARWTRARPAEVEGLYASPVLPAAAAYVEGIVRGLAQRYAVDGVHFDYVRYPNERFDYSRAAIREFRADVRPRLDEATRRALDGLERDDLFAYPDGLQDEWRLFRVARMTALMARLGRAVKQERPAALVTVAAAPEAAEAYARKMQDWPGWLAGGIVDGVAPMAYTTEPAQFAEQIAAAREAAGGRLVWAGIGAWRLSPQETVDNIQTARRLGAAGIVLFSYDSLINPRQSTPGYLETVSRGAFAGDGADGSQSMRR